MEKFHERDFEFLFAAHKIYSSILQEQWQDKDKSGAFQGAQKRLQIGLKIQLNLARSGPGLALD